MTRLARVAADLIEWAREFLHTVTIGAHRFFDSRRKA